jgi:hypothetical protein
MVEKSDKNSLDPLEKELLLHVRKLDDKDLERIIAMARALYQLAENQPFDDDLE